MSYISWFEEHANKHKKIVDKLLSQGLSKEEIIDYFDFDNMVEKESEFCPLYAQNKKCHEMDSLNCYICACPNFRFDDKGFKKVDEKTQYSFCAIESKDGSQGVYGETIHQDCSKCGVPHHKEYVEKKFDYDWRAMMKKCLPKKVVDFSVNTNLYQPKIEFSLTSEIVNRDKKSAYKELRERVATNYDLKANEVALYNSVSSAVLALFNSLKQKKVFLYAPIAGKFQKLALQSKKHIYHINRISDLHEEPLEKAIVIFANPSMPEGTYYEEIEELFEKWMELECTIIIDESFLEFENLQSLRVKINSYRKLYVLQAFTKFYACEGLNAAAIFSDAQNIKRLNPNRENISSLDSAFLIERLQDELFKERSRELHQKQKRELHVTLKESGLFDEIVPSNSNFILTHVTEGKEVFKHLKKHHILVRKCGSFDYLSDDWLRFSLKDESAHVTLKNALFSCKEVLQKDTNAYID